MTKEDKQLLLKDTCARLPYGLKVYYWEPVNLLNVQYERKQGDLVGIDTRHPCNFIIERGNNFFKDSIETTMPYLRSLLSMTKDERIEYKSLFTEQEEEYNQGCDFFTTWTLSYYDYLNISQVIDWLNAHHFDYRGLIQKGLALEAPENMYKDN